MQANHGLVLGGLISGVSGAILAGGASRRMGRNKALLPWKGGTVIETVVSLMKGIFGEVLLVAGDPEPYRFLDLPVARDSAPGLGPLGGLEAALRVAVNPRVFVVGCDMPFLDDDLIRYMASLPPAPVVVPVVGGRPEPLHALYHRDDLPLIQRLLTQGERRVQALLAGVEAKLVTEEEIRRFIDPGRAFANLNRPEDYERAREET